jgi:phage-related tail fiber protein
MDHIFESNASANTPPALPAAPSSGYPSTGNPSTGTPSTKPGPWWFYMMTEELRNVVTDVDLTPDHTNLHQLSQAIQTGKLIAANATGTANALAANFNPAIAPLSAANNGLTLHLRAAHANTTSTPALAVNGHSAKTIVKGAGVALAPGDIAGAGHWLTLQYDSTLDKWVLQNPYADPTKYVPTGTIHYFAGASAPAGYLRADGSAMSRTAYAALFAAIGTTFGVGDGSTTFNLPDLRGEFIRGWDDGREVDAGRTFGSRQAGSLNIGDDGNDVATLAFGNASLAANYGYDAVTLTQLNTDYPSRNSTGQNNSTSGAQSNGYYNNVPPYWGVSRPRNVALLACIKY